MRLTRYFFSGELIQRVIFTVIVIGALMAGVAAARYASNAAQLSQNEAAQIHEGGGEVTIENRSRAQGLMAADIERRRLLADQSRMMMVGGAGLALIGLGWLLRDILRGRRPKSPLEISKTKSIP